MIDYQPPPLLRGGHLQSMVASIALRRGPVLRRARPLLERAATEVIDCGDGVRLTVEHTPPAAAPGRMAVLIHGWEGSARSLYMLTVGARLAREGFRVLRLNLRDHGDSHHLNAGLFHSCRLDEVVRAVGVLQARFPEERLYLGGFSLGGNFALRVAARAPEAGLRIARVAAVCPVLDPAATLVALDGGLPHYRLYFLRKWRASLERKRAAFPGDYDFGELSRFRDLRTMTDFFVRHYTEYPDLATYLSGYAITGDRLAGLQVPAEVLLAEDDPVIPVGDASRLAPSRWLSVRRSPRGGHCAFIANYRLDSWLDDFVARVFSG